MPTSSMGRRFVARAKRKNSQAARAEATARRPARAAPPARTTKTATGAATMAKTTRRVSSDTDRQPGSDFHDLGLFGLDHVVDFANEVVVELLQVLLGVFDVVFRDALQLLEGITRMGTRMTYRDLPFFGELVHDLDQILASLLVHRGQRNPNHAALRGRIEPQIRLANRLLDRLGLSLVERRHDDQPRLRSRDR